MTVTFAFPDKPIVPVTGTGFDGVFTTVTGADGVTCGAAIARIGPSADIAPTIAIVVNRPTLDFMCLTPTFDWTLARNALIGTRASARI